MASIFATGPPSSPPETPLAPFRLPAPPPPPKSLADLPYDILLNIYTYLPRVRDAFSLARTCTRLAECLNDTPTLVLGPIVRRSFGHLLPHALRLVRPSPDIRSINGGRRYVKDSQLMVEGTEHLGPLSWVDLRMMRMDWYQIVHGWARLHMLTQSTPHYRRQGWYLEQTLLPYSAGFSFKFQTPLPKLPETVPWSQLDGALREWHQGFRISKRQYRHLRLLYNVMLILLPRIEDTEEVSPMQGLRAKEKEMALKALTRREAAAALSSGIVRTVIRCFWWGDPNDTLATACKPWKRYDFAESKTIELMDALVHSWNILREIDYPPEAPAPFGEDVAAWHAAIEFSETEPLFFNGGKTKFGWRVYVEQLEYDEGRVVEKVGLVLDIRRNV